MRRKCERITRKFRRCPGRFAPRVSHDVFPRSSSGFAPFLRLFAEHPEFSLRERNAGRPRSSKSSARRRTTKSRAAADLPPCSSRPRRPTRRKRTEDPAFRRRISSRRVSLSRSVRRASGAFPSAGGWAAVEVWEGERRAEEVRPGVWGRMGEGRGGQGEEGGRGGGRAVAPASAVRCSVSSPAPRSNSATRCHVRELSNRTRRSRADARASRCAVGDHTKHLTPSACSHGRNLWRSVPSAAASRMPPSAY